MCCCCLLQITFIYYGKEGEQKKRKKQETGDHLLWQTCASCSLCYFKEHSGDSFFFCCTNKYEKIRIKNMRKKQRRKALISAELTCERSGMSPRSMPTCCWDERGTLFSLAAAPSPGRSGSNVPQLL